MPYKDKKKQAEYMRKYRTPYMREYYKRQKSTWGKGNGHQLTPSELSLLKQIQETK